MKGRKMTDNLIPALGLLLANIEDDLHNDPDGQVMVSFEQNDCDLIRLGITKIKTLSSEKAKATQALSDVMAWIENWGPSFTEDEEWAETEELVKSVFDN